MTTNSLTYSDLSLLPYEAKIWIDDSFDRSLYNVVWANDEPVSLIVTVSHLGVFHLSKGITLVEIQRELAEWQSNGYPERTVE
jgi:hypothetical protein